MPTLEPARLARDAHVTALALAAGAGDRGALGEFVRLTQADVWRFLAHLTSPDAADDLTQDTFLRAMDALPGFRGEASARSWLITIARRTAADRVRAEVRRPQSPRPPEWFADRGGTTPAGDAEADLWHLVAGLSPERREAFVLTAVCGFSYVEAAQACGCPVGTVRSRVARARAQLVQGWKSAGEPNGLLRRLVG